jgi:hypothetical protein
VSPDKVILLHRNSASAGHPVTNAVSRGATNGIFYIRYFGRPLIGKVYDNILRRFFFTFYTYEINEFI